MKECEHLRVYELRLTTRSPLFVGNGKKCGKTEYLFNPRTNFVQMIDTNRFFAFLAQRGLADDYERFVFSGDNDLYNFLKNCGLTERKISDLCLYSVDAADALDGEHSLKEIHSFVRDGANRAYIPGSSIKGALRTVILHRLMEESKKGKWPEEERNKSKKARRMQELEGEYLNTLELKKDRNGHRVNDAVNSIMRGIMISDSLPISDRCIMLGGKTDVLANGEMQRINLCRECIKPGTVISFRLTLDTSVLNGTIDASWLEEAIRIFDSDYQSTFLSRFPTPRNAVNVSYDHCLILGGGSGFFPKALPYSYLGFIEGRRYTAGEMSSQFRKHGHDRDETEYGISPHTMKYCKYMGKLYPYGVCEVKLL